MNLPCPHCGKPVNPAAMLGAIRSPKKEAAWKANGVRLKRMYANARKVSESPEVVDGIPESFPGSASKIKSFLERNPITDQDTRVMPKGGMSKEELKAMISGRAQSMGQRIAQAKVEGVVDERGNIGISLHEIPCAPFDFKDEEGNLHRVKAYGKNLKVCFMRDGVEEPMRNLEPGELESLWLNRIIK